VNAFARELEETFAESGKRWKSAAADALRISRPTLYKYLSVDDDALPAVVPVDIVNRAQELAQQKRTLPAARDLAVSYARGLVALQERIDGRGFIAAPYPADLLRAFSVASALNSRSKNSIYPDNLASLLECARKPFHEWFADLDWDEVGDYTSAQLIRQGDISAECVLLGAVPNDFYEQQGYELLINRCRSIPDGQQLYVAWRRLLIETPVIESFGDVIRGQRIFLRRLDAVAELDQQFLERIPRPTGASGTLNVCPVTGTRVTFFDNEWISESRDPDIQIELKAVKPREIQWTPDTRQVKRIFRQFWVLPGYYELQLFHRAIHAGWAAELWPKFDTVDLVLRKDELAFALDVKDQINSFLLAKRFEGFRGYERDYNCFVVIPDYLTQIDTRYRARFSAVRRTHGRSTVEIKTISEVVQMIEGGR